MGTLRQQSKAATRAKVLAAAKALFETEGYVATTVREIAHAAGVSTGAVFCSWTGKAEVYREVFGHKPISPELGRALLLAARNPGIAAISDQLAAVVAQVQEA